jgi:hypothetical protein
VGHNRPASVSLTVASGMLKHVYQMSENLKFRHH